MYISSCELCRGLLTEGSEMIALRLKPRLKPEDRREIEVVDLDGRIPWMGIKCICMDCWRALSRSRTHDIPQ